MSENTQTEVAPQLPDVLNVPSKLVKVGQFELELREWTNKELAIYQTILEEASLSGDSISLFNDIQTAQTTLGPVQDRMVSAKRRVESLTLILTRQQVQLADIKADDAIVEKYLETSDLLDQAEADLRAAQSELLKGTEQLGDILGKSAEAEDSSRKVALRMCYYLSQGTVNNKELVEEYVQSCTPSDEDRALTVVDRGKGSRRRLMEDLVAQAMDKIRERFGTTTFSM